MTLRSAPAADREPPAPIDAEIGRIIGRVAPGARVIAARVMGADDGGHQHDVTAKSAGYGIPLRIDAEIEGKRRSFVLHGSSANRFGHDRRADRAAELLLAADTFSMIPRHTHVLDVGAFRGDGSSVSLKDSAEFYLLTDYAPGTPYAEDLRRIATAEVARSDDVERVQTLVDYLVDLHQERHDSPLIYERSLRDLFGSGEGIFGIVDGYPRDDRGVSFERLHRLEARCLEHRWALKQRPPRLSRIHGDFHPFNVLFDEKGELRVLDTSRGSLGDPADDVACMAVNYLFFALEHPSSWGAALRALWYRFWESYLGRTGDGELLDVVAPFLAWRVLVLACPLWYPKLATTARNRLLEFAEAALGAPRFNPEFGDDLFGGAVAS